MTDAPDDTGPTVPPHRNEVLLVGRVAAPAVRRDLPSGAVVVSVRVVVERDPLTLRERSARVDAIDCASWVATCHAAMEEWRAGDVVEVAGTLRRRFRRSEAGPISRYEVEADRVRLLAPKERVHAPRTRA